MKKVTLTLEDWRIWKDEDKSYKVQKVTNTTEYEIGQFLTMQHTKELCESSSIEVIIVSHK